MGRREAVSRPTGRSQHQVELEILHRGIERLLDDVVQAVNLVDEEDPLALQVGEDRGQVAGRYRRPNHCASLPRPAHGTGGRGTGRLARGRG